MPHAKTCPRATAKLPTSPLNDPIHERIHCTVVSSWRQQLAHNVHTEQTRQSHENLEKVIMPGKQPHDSSHHPDQIHPEIICC